MQLPISCRCRRTNTRAPGHLPHPAWPGPQAEAGPQGLGRLPEVLQGMWASCWSLH